MALSSQTVGCWYSRPPFPNTSRCRLLHRQHGPIHHPSSSINGLVIQNKLLSLSGALPAGKRLAEPDSTTRSASCPHSLPFLLHLHGKYLFHCQFIKQPMVMSSQSTLFGIIRCLEGAMMRMEMEHVSQPKTGSDDMLPPAIKVVAEA